MTRLEVVVVVVLVILALGILLPFLGRGRGLAKQVECANHLRRIGQGIEFYHDGTKSRPGSGFLPPARIDEGYATWPIVLGPYLATDNLFAEWDLQKPYAEQSAAAREAVMPVFFCPARNRTETLSQAGELDRHGARIVGGVGDYAGASGDGDPAHLWTGPKANGAIILGEVLEREDDLVLRWKSRTSFASLVRGKSYTILIGEKHVPFGHFGEVWAGDGSFYNGGNAANFSRIGGPGYGLAASMEAPFNNNFGSAHAGLCQFLHADGRVEAYANSLDEQVLGQLIRRE
ncbi:MAG: DUF1559 domain-containing protein [Planctomycetes bacterium]|nr:DUF1559 domain-containing protein [Planctomycetota bacterium]